MTGISTLMLGGGGDDDVRGIGVKTLFSARFRLLLIHQWKKQKGGKPLVKFLEQVCLDFINGRNFELTNWHSSTH